MTSTNEKMDPQKARLNPRKAGKPMPERTDSLIMGLGTKQSSAPRVQHSSTVLMLDSPRVFVELLTFDIVSGGTKKLRIANRK